jgi:hypothetical protein
MSLVLFLFAVKGQFFAEGNGKIVRLINRGGHIPGPDGRALPSGLFVELDTGQELRMASIFSEVEVGDTVVKEKYTLTYVVNAEEVNVFWKDLGASLRGGAIFVLALAVLFALALAGFGVFKAIRSHRPQ